MCGIVGVLGPDSKIHERVDLALGVIKYRGPDYFQKKRVHPHLTLGHVRLSIVDLNVRSAQPMVDEKNGNVLCFNGEVYNFLDLEKKVDRRFRTTSDTELLLYFLEQHGVQKVFQECNGMWAFAFYQASDHSLTLARDRMGKKPLFYTWHKGHLLFASEAKALEALGVKLVPNHKAVINFMMERTVGSYNESFFEGIYQIEPGTASTFSVDACSTNSVLRHWEFPDKVDHCIRYDDAVQTFKELLEDSVRLRFSDEVPFAFLVSGGLDSSAIASFAAASGRDREFTAISAIFPDSVNDESAYAEEVVKKYPNIKRHFVTIKPDKFSQFIEKTVYHQETPVADGSMISHHMLMKEIADLGIKVVLSGNGGDEVLAGYQQSMFPISRVEQLKQFKFPKIPRREMLDVIFQMLPNKFKQFYKLSSYYRSGLLRKTAALKWLYPRYDKVISHESDVNDLLIRLITHWSLPGFVWYEDRNSMAYSIEARSPFLDYRIVELMLFLPGRYKIDDEFSKRILRDATKGILPESIRVRKDKQGFDSPIEQWEHIIDYQFAENQEFIDCFDYLNIKDVRRLPFHFRWRLFTLFVWFNLFFIKEDRTLFEC